MSTTSEILAKWQEADQRLVDEYNDFGFLLTVASLWEARTEIERLTAERDELRRQLDPMGEYASADELIAALRAEKAADDAMKLDAQRYRWLRNEANTARKCDPMVCIYPLDEQDLIDGDRLDAAIDAAMGLTRPAEES